MPTAPSRSKRLRNRCWSALLLSGALGTAACTPTINNSGARLDVDAVAEVRPGSSSREEVQRLLGSPSSLGTFDDKRWYYITQRTEQMTFYKKEIVAQDVVAIDFDDKGVVAAIDRYGLVDAKAIEPSTDRTPTSGNEITILQQLLGNIGKFNTDPGGIGRANNPDQGPGQR